MASRAVLLGLIVVFGLVVAGSAQDCPVAYGGGGRPLLFGGLFDSTCALKQNGTQCARDPRWVDACKYTPSDNKFAVCTEEQRQLGLRTAEQLYGGAALHASPCELHTYLRGRTLWLIGDSHTKQLFRAVQCFMIDFWEGQKECKVSPDPVLQQSLDNLPVKGGESKCINLVGGGRVCQVHVVLGTSLLNNPQVADNGVLHFIRGKFAKPSDIFIVQFAPWHAKEGPPGIERMKQALHVLGEDYQRNRWQWPHMIFRESPMSHPKDAAKGVCMPAPSGWTYDPVSGKISVDPTARSAEAALISRGGTFNAPSREILPQYSMPIMGGYSYSVPLFNAHVGMRGVPEVDCLHYCSHGLPEIIVYEMLKNFKEGMAGIQPINWVPPEQKFTCTPMK